MKKPKRSSVVFFRTHDKDGGKKSKKQGDDAGGKKSRSFVMDLLDKGLSFVSAEAADRVAQRKAEELLEDEDEDGDKNKGKASKKKRGGGKKPQRGETAGKWKKVEKPGRVSVTLNAKHQGTVRLCFQLPMK